MERFHRFVALASFLMILAGAAAATSIDHADLNSSFIENRTDHNLTERLEQRIGEKEEKREGSLEKKVERKLRQKTQQMKQQESIKSVSSSQSKSKGFLSTIISTFFG
ncbi:MAG: hypothetical protein ABEK16_00965 [Candidatus Nanohalobium sp.]